MIPGVADEDEEKQFSSISELVEMSMTLASILFQEQLSEIDKQQEKLYRAFELGVIEYYDRVFLRRAETDAENANARFFNFLIYYANQKYGENGEDVFQLWSSLALDGLMHHERELGFDSVNEGVNPDGTKKIGHYSALYLKKAVRF